MFRSETLYIQVIPMTDFLKLPISTSVLVCPTNLVINQEWLFNSLPLYEVPNIPKTIKDDRKFQEYMIKHDPPYGSIVMIKYKIHTRGVRYKKKSPFRNNVIINMYIGKIISIKVPSKGKLHFTGCKEDIHHDYFIKTLWRHLIQYPQSPDTWSIDGDELKVFVIPVSCNKVARVGFRIDRDKLNQFINMNTDLQSFYIPQGNPGVAVRSSIHIDDDDLMVKVIQSGTEHDVMRTSQCTYAEYAASDFEVKFLFNKSKKKNTFIVFHSGNINMSGLLPYMGVDYKNFIQLLYENRDKIESKSIDKMNLKSLRKPRLGGIVLFDTVLTIISAVFISRFTRLNTAETFVLLILLSIPLHDVLRVDTATNRALGIRVFK